MPESKIKGALTTGQVARVCRVAPRTVTKWCERGLLDYYLLPGSEDRRVNQEALLRFMGEYGLPLAWLTPTLGLVYAGYDENLALRLRAEVPRVVETVCLLEAGLWLGTGEYGVAVLDLALGRTDALAAAGSLRRRLGRGVAVALLLPDGDGDAEPAWEVSDLVLAKPFDAGELTNWLTRAPEVRQQPTRKPQAYHRRPGRPPKYGTKSLNSNPTSLNGSTAYGRG